MTEMDGIGPPIDSLVRCLRCLGHGWVPGDRDGLDYGYHPTERQTCPRCEGSASLDHPFIWSPECYDVCRICGGVRNGHPTPRRLEEVIADDE